MTDPAAETAQPIDLAPARGRRRLLSLFAGFCAGALALGNAPACSFTDDVASDGAGTDIDAGPGGGGDPSGGAGGVDAGGGSGADGGDCPLGLPRDPSALLECCPEFGPAHCLPGAELDPVATQQLAACEDGQSYCAPDVWIEGNVDLLPCTSVLAAAGVCLSLCIPLVAENEAVLPQDVCAANEKCVPCINPLDMMPTGACELDLSCDAPDGESGDGDGAGGGVPPANPAAACCDSRGVCIPGELAGEQAENLQQDSCQGEGELCAPVDLIDGSFVAEPCRSTIGAIGGHPEGACMHDCLARTGLFLQDGCADGFRCVACELPFLGETGACDFLPGGN